MTARVSVPFCEPSSRPYRHLLQNAGVCVYECMEWRWEWGRGAESWVRVPLHCASAALDLHAGRVGKLQSSPPGDRHREGLSAALDCRPFPVLTVSGAATVGAWLHVPKTHSRGGRGRSQTELCGLGEAPGQHSQRQRGGGAAGEEPGAASGL